MSRARLLTGGNENNNNNTSARDFVRDHKRIAQLLSSIRPRNFLVRVDENCTMVKTLRGLARRTRKKLGRVLEKKKREFESSERATEQIKKKKKKKRKKILLA